MIKLCSVGKYWVTIKLKVAIFGSMLDAEECTQAALNEAELPLTQALLKQFDHLFTAKHFRRGVNAYHI